jgi:urease accessory protein
MSGDIFCEQQRIATKFGLLGVPISPCEPMKTGWVAELRLRYQCEQARTLLREKSHVGPLVVQKALYPEGDGVCHSIIVHPPGGIAGSDQLSIDAQADAGSHVLLTTPGATRWYRTLGAEARQQISLTAGAGATIEWLPQETIYFNEAIAHNGLHVSLAADACFIGWEIACLGRQSSGEIFERGRVRQAMSIDVEGRPVFIERGTLSATDVAMPSPIGLAGNSVYGTFIAHAPACDEKLLEACRSVLPKAENTGLTLIGSTLVGRCLGTSSEEMKQLFIQWWSIVREPLTGQPATPPRIWRT